MSENVQDNQGGERREGGYNRGGGGGRREGGFNRGGGGGGRREGGFGGGRGPRQRRFRGKVCPFTVEKITYIDWKDIDRLQRFMTDAGKIVSRRQSGCSARYQRMLTTAIKRARVMALLPYTTR